MKKINRAIGELEISFSEDGISRLHCTAPLRAFVNDDGINEIPSAVIINTSGGVVSGDRYDVTINVKKNSITIFPIECKSGKGKIMWNDNRIFNKI